MYDPYDPYDPHNPHNEPWAKGLSFNEVEMIENNTVTDREARLVSKAEKMGVNRLSDTELSELSGTTMPGLSKRINTEKIKRRSEQKPDIVPPESINVSASSNLAVPSMDHDCKNYSSEIRITEFDGSESSYELIKEMELTTGEFLLWLKTDRPLRYAVYLMDKKGLVRGWDGEPKYDHHGYYDFMANKCEECGLYILSYVG